MSEENKKVKQSEAEAEAAELSERELDNVAGGAVQPLVAKPGTGPAYPPPQQGPNGKI